MDYKSPFQDDEIVKFTYEMDEAFWEGKIWKKYPEVKMVKNSDVWFESLEVIIEGKYRDILEFLFEMYEPDIEECDYYIANNRIK